MPVKESHKNYFSARLETYFNNIRTSTDPATKFIPLKGKLLWTYGFLFITVSLMTASVVVGHGIVRLHENPLLGPSVDSLLLIGGLRGANVRNGEWWRLFWAPYLHAGWFHFLLNCLLWYKLSVMVEPDWGFTRTAFIFNCSALTGNLLSSVLDDNNVSVGASGGIFGIMGGCIPYIIEYWYTIPQPKLMMYVVIVSIVLGLLGGFLPYVDNYAHLGGAIGGVLLGFVTISNVEVLKLDSPLHYKSWRKRAGNLSIVKKDPQLLIAKPPSIAVPLNEAIFQQRLPTVQSESIAVTNSNLLRTSAFNIQNNNFTATEARSATLYPENLRNSNGNSFVHIGDSSLYEASRSLSMPMDRTEDSLPVQQDANEIAADASLRACHSLDSYHSSCRLGHDSEIQVSSYEKPDINVTDAYSDTKYDAYRDASRSNVDLCQETVVGSSKNSRDGQQHWKRLNSRAGTTNSIHVLFPPQQESMSDELGIHGTRANKFKNGKTMSSITSFATGFSRFQARAKRAFKCSYTRICLIRRRVIALCSCCVKHFMWRPRDECQAPTRVTLRKTRDDDIDDSFVWNDGFTWAVRGSAASLLAFMWFLLFYFLLICPTCYSPPGQVIQLYQHSL